MKQFKLVPSTECTEDLDLGSGCTLLLTASWTNHCDALANALHEVSSMHLNTSNTYVCWSHMGSAGGDPNCHRENVYHRTNNNNNNDDFKIILFVCFLTLELQ